MAQPKITFQGWANKIHLTNKINYPSFSQSHNTRVLQKHGNEAVIAEINPQLKPIHPWHLTKICLK